MTREDYETIAEAVENNLRAAIAADDCAGMRLQQAWRDGFELSSDAIALAVDARVRDRARLRALQRAQAALRALAEVRVTTIDALREACDRAEGWAFSADREMRKVADGDVELWGAAARACSQARARTRACLRRVRRALAVAEGWE